MQVKQRYFTLIETIVSLGLVAIIVTFLFGFFAKITKVEKNLEDLKKEVYAKNNLHIRFNQILANVITDDFFDGSFFYLSFEKNDKNPTLNITFDNGIDPNPNFSETIKARIFVNKEKNLILEMTSRNKKVQTKREEILYSEVKKIEYNFLDTKDLKMQKYKIENVGLDQYWYNFWPKDKKVLPSTVKIAVNNNLNFVFFLRSQSVKI